MGIDPDPGESGEGVERVGGLGFRFSGVMGEWGPVWASGLVQLGHGPGRGSSIFFLLALGFSSFFLFCIVFCFCVFFYFSF